MMNGKTSKAESKIPILSPVPLRRSGSLRSSVCTPIQEHRSNTIPRAKINHHRSLQSLNTASSVSFEQDDDADSVRSFSSTASVCSNASQCEHSAFARNGTTYSGRCKRYVVHCSPHQSEVDDYLTPTQRTNRTIRKLRNLLKEAQAELADKDKEILRLSKEVVELRLLKVGLSPDETDKDEVENLPSDGTQNGKGSSSSEPFSISPHPSRYCSSPPLAQSLSDSGHFEDLNSSKDHSLASRSQVKTIETLQRQHEDEIRDLKEKHNDKVDSLLQRITDVNDRYYALRPLYEDCKEKLHELERINEELRCSGNQNQTDKEVELANINSQLTQENESLQSEIRNLRNINSELQTLVADLERLKIENTELKTKEEELKRLLDVAYEDYKDHRSPPTSVASNSSQTESFEAVVVPDSDKVNKDHRSPPTSVASNSSQTESFEAVVVPDSDKVKDDCCDENHHCRYKEEITELHAQIVDHRERLKQMEDDQRSEKDIYMQLYKKGIQAAKLDAEGGESGELPESESSVIPDLLHKLQIKQEELDNIKAMYRRLLEAKKQAPKHDPEMTLQFLKSAFYYFLTDRDNAQGHLAAIESILGFSDCEKTNIDKAFLWR